MLPKDLRFPSPIPTKFAETLVSLSVKWTYSNSTYLAGLVLEIEPFFLFENPEKEFIWKELNVNIQAVTT